ncbi:hypothetical protein SKAU_G00425020 [Synaphobranchus kaupii]|uniref:Polyhomeotic-like protein 2 n=1 Tax=Synaphobranchus kaupii TaxID=118154 RepID=A0A9Q1I8T2_SYNKA|nr:hypothetical protein SKAU_G00425020 [Synaphobranchus kaupii]
MESEQSSAACGVSSMGSGNPNPNPNPTTAGNGSRPTVPQISVYSGIPDRQTVQVIQQALNRQPSTAAQYLQQMYAAQQQHLMLQTAALQQQHLSTAQLQSLAAVQQASLAAGRQNSAQNGTQQTGSAAQTTINLATSPAAAQLITRAQSISAAPAGITQQAVLLGNASNPTLTASQAQMYLRAQMLIFTPTATVTTVQSEATAPPAGQVTTAQVQNLPLRSQQGAPAQPQLQALSLKPAPGGPQLSLSGLAPPIAQLKLPGQGPQGPGAGGKGPGNEAPTEGMKKGEGPNDLMTRLVNVTRNVTSVTNHHLITPAYTQIQPHQLQPKQQQQQYVIQQQPQLTQRSPTPLLQTSPIQAGLQNHNQNQAQTQLQLPVQALPLQPAPASQCAISVLPKPPVPAHQATIFHSTLGPPLAPSKSQPVQLTAVNLQIQPAPAPALVTVPTLAPAVCMVQDGSGKDQPTPLVVRETLPTPSCQQLTSAPPPGGHAHLRAAKPLSLLFHRLNALQTRLGQTEQRRVLPPPPPPPPPPGDYCQNPHSGGAEGVNAKSGGGRHSAMTSGNGNNGPAVADSTPQNGESKPPQAIVKPQILTHVIEGFVIQEGAEPFPVDRPSLLLDNLQKQKLQVQSDSEKLPANTCTTDTEMEDLSQQELKEQEPMLKCELCGLVDFASNFKRSKRFCSTVCAKRYSVRCSKRMGLIHPDRSKTEKHKKGRSRSSTPQTTETKKQAPSVPPQSVGVAAPPRLPSHPRQGESSQCSDMSSYEEAPSPLSAASSGVPRPHGERGSDQGQGLARELPLLTQHFLPSDPAQWNVTDVYEFICSLPGCQEIAEEFRSQEIDGQALLLLKEDHLMSTMNIKLGPALKIFAQISLLKDS